MAHRFLRVAALVAVALAGVAGAAPAAEPRQDPDILKHAVVCPPFKGDPTLAAVYHNEMVKILRASTAVELYEGTRQLPDFYFLINGSIVTNEDKQFFVLVTVFDSERKEQMASHVAPATLDPEAIIGWTKLLQADIARRCSHLPFECRISRKLGQESITLDRGLGSGLQPGMVLYVSEDEEPLLSPVTGAVIGRDSPRAAGQIQVFRVLDETAYARPVLNTKLPRTAKLFARSF